MFFSWNYYIGKLVNKLSLIHKLILNGRMALFHIHSNQLDNVVS